MISAPGSVLGEARGAEGNENVMVENLDFQLRPGQLIVVLGPNGAGKSTLLRVLAGLTPPTAGVVRLNGVPLMAWTATGRARHIAWMGHEPVDADLTVAEATLLARLPWQAHGGGTDGGMERRGASPVEQVVTGVAHRAWWRLWGHHMAGMGAKLGASLWGLGASIWTARDHARVEAALRTCDMAELANRPLGTLSAGERRRADLARALAQDTPFLLLDEPTAHLDWGRRLEFLDRLRGLTHRFDEKCGSVTPAATSRFTPLALKEDGKRPHTFRDDATSAGELPRGIVCVLHEPSDAAALGAPTLLLYGGGARWLSPQHADEWRYELGRAYGVPQSLVPCATPMTSDSPQWPSTRHP